MTPLFNILSMDHYGFYIWSAYGIGALIIVGNIVHVHYLRVKAKKLLQAWFKQAL